MNSSKFLWWLVAIYGVLFSVLAINPVDRTTWFAENLTVWVILAVILVLYAINVRFSKLAYGMMFILIYLHTIGGHYTFSEVPFSLVTDTFGFARNHFDRMAHFSVGFYAFAIAEYLLLRKMVTTKFLLFTYPIFVVATIAMGYEIIEWLYAAGSSPEATAAYLGSQGDIWDAQKDMLSDTLGAITGMIVFFVSNKLWGKPWGSAENEAKMRGVDKI
jgi:putative membrane protein